MADHWMVRNGTGLLRDGVRNSLGDVNNRYWYYHAENDDSSIVWAGPIPVYVTDEAFNHCLNIGTSNSRIVGYRQIDVGDNDDFTVTLFDLDSGIHPI